MAIVKRLLTTVCLCRKLDSGASAKKKLFFFWNQYPVKGHHTSRDHYVNAAIPAEAQKITFLFMKNIGLNKS